jgi:hypothetical protein
MPKAKTKRPRAKRQAKVIVFPVASVGPCSNALRPGYRCESFDAELANGLCLPCWDRSTDESPTPKPK